MACCGGISTDYSEMDYNHAMQSLETDQLFREFPFVSCSPFDELARWRSDWGHCFIYFDGAYCDPRTIQAADSKEKTVTLFMLSETGSGFSMANDYQPNTVILEAETAVQIFVPGNYFICEECYNKARKKQWWII